MFSLKQLSKRVQLLRTTKTKYKTSFDVFAFMEKINIENDSYMQIENGYSMPSECNLLTIAEYYNVSAEWILTGIPTCDYEAQLNEEFKKIEEENKEALRKLGIYD